ncbi:G-protein beta WD-40 repeats containing protein [Reticulomyxa filosa]|uniref:G-protein beta WD-40 repeats containing protein n=1 Tax=Reticulomyxa filosa TaxID=46433 RepID=X6M0M8_RETFI|nr:G-protein beta WD-40 repeats containing protein [Reticulomyxa filosa]|eukprot:ETO07728.1 G-protein beta WD-40 repeats containing protein [Reticulomyxa filosa]
MIKNIRCRFEISFPRKYQYSEKNIVAIVIIGPTIICYLYLTSEKLKQRKSQKSANLLSEKTLMKLCFSFILQIYISSLSLFSIGSDLRPFKLDGLALLIKLSHDTFSVFALQKYYCFLESYTNNRLNTINNYQYFINIQRVDGTKLVASFYDNTIGILDLKLKTIQLLGKHSDWVNDVQFSSDDNIIVSCSNDKTIRLWNVNSVEEPIICKGHTSIVLSCQFSPNDNTILSGSWDQTIRLWDVKSGQEIKRMQMPFSRVYDAQFSPDGQFIVSALADATIEIWSVELSEKVQKLKGHSKEVFKAQFSPDGKYIVSGSIDKTIRIWDVTSGKEVKRLCGHLDTIKSVRYFLDHHNIVSVAWDNTIRVWNIKTGKEIQILQTHSRDINGVDVSPDGQTIVSCCSDGKIQLWG